jgi:putative two-component system response regulator
VCALSSALDARDQYTRGHSDRVASYALGIARQLGWSSRKLREIELAGHLHDVGKIGVPDAVLLKPGRLSPEEYATVQKHVEDSVAVVRNIPELKSVAMDILQHHERLDGSGYPHGLIGDDISQAARILGVADSFDAMTSTRSYRPAMPVEQAIRLIKAEAGTKYDQTIVDTLILLNQEGDVEGMLAYTYCLSH